MVSEAEIVKWACAELADLLSRPVEEISPGVSFAQLGVDSGRATHLLLALEDRFDIEVDPDAALELPTIAALCAYVGRLVAKRST